MKEIAGWQILETLYQGRHSVVYRGLKQEQSVIIKVPSSPRAETKLLQEFQIGQRISSEHVVKFIELKLDSTYGHILIEEDDQAESLLHIIPANGYTPLAFLNIAIQLAEGLQHIHESNVIHKDIKSANIIIRSDTGKIKYIDFNSASMLRNNQQTKINPISTTQATLAYISPEQTGRINRMIDYRTDFYSLGVTFYQLLCGRLPFTVKTVAELVHCHLAKQPLAPHKIRPCVPQAVSDIVMKLMQKNAEYRYQSACGLLADLKKCFGELSQTGKVQPFALAEQDITNYFSIPGKLYGRELEISLLTQACDRISQGSTEIVMVAGAPGTGKSALVQEIQPIIAAKGGYFLMGKYESVKCHTAYSAITQAFQCWIQQVLASSDEEIMRWKTHLLHELGNQGQILIDVFPDLELIIGQQTPLPMLDAEQTKIRFHVVFQLFVSALSGPSNPLLLFLDDWQWADPGSLALLEALVTSSGIQHFLLIGAYRDNEVDYLHATLHTLETIQKAGIPVQVVTLQQLSLSIVNQWVADTMHNSLEATFPLTTVIYQKTEGLPFFVKVFIQTLYDQGFLLQVEGHWQWDLENIRHLPATENVISFLVQHLQQLTPAIQDTLQVASCVGHWFSFDILHQVKESPKEELQSELLSVVEKGLLLQSEDHFWFAHDRIQEAVCQQIPQERYATIHLSIGRKLKTNSKQQLSEAVNHLNLGKGFIQDESELIELAELNLAVGKKAKQDIAYVSALNYLQMAESCFATMNIWQQNYSLALEVYKELADAEHLNMNYESSESYIELLLFHCQNAMEKVDIYDLRIIHQTVRAQYQEAVNTGYRGLKLLEIELPSQDLSSQCENELNLVKKELQNKTMDVLLNAPQMSDSKTKICMKILHNLLTASYFCNQDLHDYIVAKMVNLIFYYGNTVESAMVYATYSMLLVYKWKEIQRGHALGVLALKISEKSNNLVSQCRTYVLYADFIHHWKLPLEQVETLISRAQQAGEEAGDFQYAGYSLLCKISYLFHTTTPLTVLEKELNRCLQIPYNRSNKLVLAFIHCVMLTVLNLTAQTSGVTVFQDSTQTDIEYQTEWQQDQQFAVVFNFLVLKAQALYLHQETRVSLEVLTEAEKYLHLVPGFITVVSYHFYSALSMLALYPASNSGTQRIFLEKVETHQMQMKIWAEQCPENFMHKFLLVAAELASIARDLWDAEGKYEKAIQAAQKYASLQDQALTNELAAKFFLNQNKLNCARGLMQAAYQLYERWGAKGKLDQLISQYGEVFKPLAPNLSSFCISGEEGISANSLRLLDLSTILKTSQAISSEVDLPKLLVKILNILIENAGAQKGAFLLAESGHLLVQAEYTTEGKVETLQQVPLSHWEGGVRSIVEYVKRTQQSVLLSDTSTDKRFNQDPYVSMHHILSVLCIPVIRHKQLKGILYLENNLAPNIFSEQHLQILTILSSQIAISLENAIFCKSIRSVSGRLNLALQSGNVGTWSWSIKKNKIFWDQYMCDLHGIKQEEFGQTYESAMALVHPDDVSQVEQAIKRTLSDNEPFAMEYRIIRQDKSIHVMEAQGKVFRDDKQQAERLIGVVWDVTERKKLEEERLQAVTQAEEKERRRAEDAEKYRKNLEDFINLVCHEIRNPMTGIYGNIDFLQQTATSLKSILNTIPKETQCKGVKILNRLDECTKQIEQCIKHQKAIIDDVLDLSKLESGKTTLASHPFSLKTIITEVAQIFTAPIELKHLSLFLSLPDTDPWIKGDENRLKMVLINIMANALKFTEQGHIKITLQLEEVTTIYTIFTICVEDTGIGMTSEEQSQLFQRFARVAAAEFEGSGLGLYISKRFVECMGGDIIVQSQKGQGSEFAIHLKLESTQPEEERKPAPQSYHSPTQPLPVLPAAKHILVVEDNVVNQRILHRQLEQAGHHCEVANNGQEALEKWSASSFDLIFMDIEMPVMGGFEATQTIRKQEQQLDIKCRIPIVGLSAYTSSEFIKQAHDTGMDDYITKPYEKEKLYQAIAKCTEMEREKTNKSLFQTSNEMSPTTQHKKARIE